MKNRMFTLPNLITLANLALGCAATVAALSTGGRLNLAFWLIAAAAVCDFADGLAARLTGQYSDLGAQLDSLADVVSFGVAPSAVLFTVYRYSPSVFGGVPEWLTDGVGWAVFAVALFSALRLARFNVDGMQKTGPKRVAASRATASGVAVSRVATKSATAKGGAATAGTQPAAAKKATVHKATVQKDEPQKATVQKDEPQGDEFTGLPVPAAALATVALGWMWYRGQIFPPREAIVVFVAVVSYALICPLKMFSLKFSDFGWAGNEIRWVFIAFSAALLVVFGIGGIPLAVGLYVAMGAARHFYLRSRKIL
ncbi:MAG: CDP-alcohol phosphatidyltransferase family protein [Alistipes sp.]|jgi:phosphatidylserine synthase|nr:CDP-alcohol phosphatidyltransferase family protein [Alistipes sp.]